MNTFAGVIILFVAYLVGSIPCGLLAGRANGIDVRRYGSGNLLGLVEERRPEQKDIEQYRAFLQDGRRTAKVAGNWLEALNKYRGYLDHVKVVDPACGSGAFLVQALEHLKAEHQ